MTKGRFLPTTHPQAAAPGSILIVSPRRRKRWRHLAMAMVLLLFLAVAAKAQPVLTTLASFNYLTYGASPFGALAPGSGGVFYGTAYVGGTNGGYGTVFQVTTNGLLTTLTAFDSDNGAFPYAGLTLGTDGNFYGTTSVGGDNGDGTIFQLTTNGCLTTLASFGGTNGAAPIAGLTLGADGNFYGTTSVGGDNDDGTVFRVTTNGLLTSLASFNSTNGAEPYGNLAPGNDGNFYGTTYIGGTNGGYGTVYCVTTNGWLTTLVSFNQTNGANPYAGLTLGADGSFYGTTRNGGTNGGYGTVFRVTTNGCLTSLVSFNQTNGASPYAGLTLGADGNFYGVSTGGGTNGGYGTVFQVTANGSLTTLIAFDRADGAQPYGGLTPGADGNLYGTTSNGGTNGGGTVFALSLPVPPVIYLGDAALMNGQFLLAFTNYLPAASYTVVSATNLETPMSNWIEAATSSNLSTGYFQFAIPASTNDVQRFYRLQLIQ
jgi:uncharacterized repeat protein (TIGR03803 family)